MLNSVRHKADLPFIQIFFPENEGNLDVKTENSGFLCLEFDRDFYIIVI